MELIELLELKGNIVTADAMHCLKKVAKAIHSKGGVSILQVKNNQSKLATEMVADFHKTRRDLPKDIKANSLTLINDGHGRIEERTYVQLPITPWLTQSQDWTKIKSVIEVTRKRYLKDKETSETAYYISSLEVNLPQIAKAICSHWSIENASHWVLDMTYQEGDSRIRRGDTPENMATFHRFAMNLARMSPIKDSIKGKLKQSAWSDEVREKLFFA